jgi:hypothetical protein
MTPNPKIRELIMSMGIIPESEHYDIAERVIEECIGCCESVISDPVPESVDTWLSGGEQCIQEIKEHFGYGMSVADKKQLIKDLLGVQQ